MRNRLATYIQAAFPYPAAYQSDGAGGLMLLPPLRIPTAVVQAQSAAPSACSGKKQCNCHGLCCGRKRLRGLGDPTDPNDPNFDYNSLSFPDNSSSSSSSSSTSTTDPNSPNFDYSTIPFPGTPPTFPQPSTSPSGPSGTSVPALINALSQAGGRIIASTRGITPQQFAAQNPQLTPAQAQAQYQKLYGTQQASVAGTGLSTVVGGLPIWGWGLGLLALAVAPRILGGGK